MAKMTEEKLKKYINKVRKAYEDGKLEETLTMLHKFRHDMVEAGFWSGDLTQNYALLVEEIMKEKNK